MSDKTRKDEEFVRHDIDAMMRRAYTDYSMSVIIGRALPDVRDGFKPVHRRCLYAMHDMGNRHDRPYKKSARIVGDVIGKYHPHGDTAAYDTIVRMAQPFSLRMPLVDGQGNFGSVDGDSPAAMRYTEVRLSPIASELLAELPQETVDWTKNYDASLEEPSVLPVRFPQLLVNGSSGIAVGMATSIPPHNLSEVIAATVLVMENPTCSVEDLLRVMPGPDFPTGAQIVGRDGIESAYATGRGKVLMRARSHVEKCGRDRQQLVFTEIPYMVNKAKTIEKIAELANEKKIEGIAELRDESDRDGIRLVVELRKEVNATKVLADIYRLTQLQSSFGVIMLAINDAMPKVMPLKAVLQAFITFRRQTVLRRTRFELAKAEARLHILDGLIRALGMLDEIIALIRASKSPERARAELVARLGFSQIQAQAILDMRLQRLTALESTKLAEEHAALVAEVARLRLIVSSQVELDRVIKHELLAIARDYSSARRTEIVGAIAEQSGEASVVVSGNVVVEEVAETDYVLAVSGRDQVVKIQPDQFRRLALENGLPALSSAVLSKPRGATLAVTAAGRLYWLKTSDVPDFARGGGWRTFASLLQFADDRVVALLPVDSYADGFLVTVSARGQVKRTLLSEFSNQRVTGIAAAGVDAGDSIVAAFTAGEAAHVLLATSAGMAIRFRLSDARPMGRMAAGVRGITLRNDSSVVSALGLGDGDQELIVIMDGGYWKRIGAAEIPVQGRGGQGVVIAKTGPKNGAVSCVARASGANLSVAGDAGAMLIPASSAPLMGRPSLGEKFTFASVKPNIEGVLNFEELINQGGQQ